MQYAVIIVIAVVLVVLFARRANRPRAETGGGCTNWVSGGTSVGNVLPRCGEADEKPPHIVHGKLTAYNSGKACYATFLTDMVADSSEISRLSDQAYKMCGRHPDAYICVAAYACGPAPADDPSCREFVMV